MNQPARTVTINGKELPWPMGCPFFEFRRNRPWFNVGTDADCLDSFVLDCDFEDDPILADVFQIIAAVAAEWCRHKSMVLENEANNSIYYGLGNSLQNAVRSVIKKESKFWADAATAWRSQIVWPQPETKETTP